MVARPGEERERGDGPGRARLLGTDVEPLHLVCRAEGLCLLVVEVDGDRGATAEGHLVAHGGERAVEVASEGGAGHCGGARHAREGTCCAVHGFSGLDWWCQEWRKEGAEGIRERR